MLEALPAAQSAGQKAQEDAQLGQGSIFDFGGEGDSAGGSGSAAHRPVISGNEFERRELLALEKETLGTYLSSHPLAEVRDALRARVDCPIRDLERKPDNSWVKVGGLVTECKTIRTKSGNQMMFATLDDVEAQVEMLVFKADSAESAQVIQPDAVVIVRGRVDHKEPGETKLVVTEAEAFEPNAAEIARAGAAARAPQGPVRLTIDAADSVADHRRRPQGSLRAAPRRGRGDPRHAHPQRHPLPAFRPRLPGPRLQRPARGARQPPRVRRPRGLRPGRARRSDRTARLHFPQGWRQAIVRTRPLKPASAAGAGRSATS